MIYRGDLSGRCFNGTYCNQGMTHAPDLLNQACPTGYYCPTSTAYPMACPPGTYNSQTGQDALSDCVTTEAGMYSIAASTLPTGQCNPGHYCPAGSSGPNQVSCPAGYYLPTYGGRSSGDCSLCVAGYYCPKGSADLISCPRGKYCPAGVSQPIPCSPGSYGNTSNAVSSSQCIVCDGGSYCDAYGLTEPKGLCSPGFYCYSGSNTSTPRSYDIYLNYRNTISQNLSFTGGICPAGAYCPAGSKLPTPCESGFINRMIGSSTNVSCVKCTPGYYCQGFGNAQTTGLCSAGFYCSGGATVPTQFESLPGYYSTAGSSRMLSCTPGQYNPSFRSSSCLACPEGMIIIPFY